MLAGVPAYGSTPSERSTMAGALAFLFASGGLLVAACLLLPYGGDSQPVLVLVPAGTALVVAAFLLRFREEVSLRAHEALLALGTVLISIVIYGGGRLGEGYPLIYVWVSLFAWFFFSTRMAVAQMAFVAVLSAVALTQNDEIDVAWPIWLMTVGSITVAGVLIGRLTNAVRAQASDLAAVSRMAMGLSDLGASAQAACDGVRETTRADVAIFLEPLAGEEGVQVTAMAGPSEAGQAFAGELARKALQQAFTSGEAVDVCADVEHRFDGDLLGVAQPVLRDGQAAAVLAVAWTRPRRRIGQRARNAALLFAAQAAVAMDRAEEQRLDRERRALEINDNIVQGLVVAKYCAQRGDVDRALEAIDETLDRARRLITDQLEAVSTKQGGLQPGDLARATASSVSQSPHGSSGG